MKIPIESTKVRSHVSTADHYRTVRLMTGFVWRASPKLFVGMLALTLISGLMPLVPVAVTHDALIQRKGSYARLWQLHHEVGSRAANADACTLDTVAPTQIHR